MRGVILPSSVKNQRFLPASPQGEAFGRYRASACKQQFTVLPAYKEKEEDSKAFLLHFPALVSLGGQDLTAIVVAASLASSMGLNGLAALGADGYAGSGQLPVGATALIATGLGHFTLRDSHGDTSLVNLLSQHSFLRFLIEKLP